MKPESVNEEEPKRDIINETKFSIICVYVLQIETI